MKQTNKVLIAILVFALIFSFGTSDTVSFLTVISFARMKVALCLISFDEAPIFTSYFPASAIHDEIAGSKDERR